MRKSKNEYVILTLLQQNQDLSFSQLRYKSGLDRSSLTKCLNRLQSRNLVENFYEKREGTKDHSFYRLTTEGKYHLLFILRSKLI